MIRGLQAIVTLGIYIHIPFCESKCSYCHFVSMPLQEFDVCRYIKAVLREMELFCASRTKREEADSIYFGGGTPSLLPADFIGEILESCRRLFAVADDCEISLEANPGTLSAAKAESYRRSGVNRVSVGAQSFDAGELASIGRRHTPAMIAGSVDCLRENGFRAINLDLMLGLPLQTAASWRQTLALDGLAVSHLSVYMLDLDDVCPLQSMVQSGAVRLPEEDLVSDLYLETLDFLASQGYAQYEISNFAHPGYECRHNLKYWMREPVQGFGLASHSFDGKTRLANFSQMDEYLRAIEAGRAPVSWRRPVTEEQALEETLFLGLRLNRGVDWGRLIDLAGRQRMKKYEGPLEELSGRGWVEWNGSTVRLTPAGMLLSNEIFQLFV